MSTTHSQPHEPHPPPTTLPISFPAEFELREIAAARIPGTSIFDISPKNILGYRCGSWALIERDIKIVLPAETAQHVLDHLDASGLQQAFRVRQELVNYKKVLLHVHQQGLQLARSLSQLATFFHDESICCEGGFSMPTERRGRITDAATQCKGRAEATYDARLLGKLLCNLPRHPAKALPRDLQELPQSMRCWRVLSAARKEPEKEARKDESSGEGGGGSLSAQHDKHGKDLTGEVDAEDLNPDDGKDVVEDPSLQKTLGPSAALVNQTTWPEHIKDFVRLVLISRGGDKALRIREELNEVRRRLKECIEAAESAFELVKARPAPQDVAEQIRNSVAARSEVAGGEQQARLQMGAAMQRQRDFNLLSGCAPVLRETLHWLAAIEDAAASDAARLFLAGDGRGVPTVRYGARPEAPPTFCTPKGFNGGSGPEDQEMVRVVQEYSQQMQAILASEGWPATICSKIVGDAAAVAVVGGGGGAPKAPTLTEGTVRTAATAAAAPSPEAATASDMQPSPAGATEPATSSSNKSGAKRTPCIHCGRKFSALWLQQGVCCQCEATWRSERKCPFAAAAKSCSPLWFCPHHRRCLKCECQSCEDCRFTRGDGEHVRLLATRLRPKRIVLDFDRTLASTRSGAVPIIGKDSIDDDLFSLIWDHPEACMVVTRNRHVEEIKNFLAALDVPRIDVHSLKRPRSKAEFVLMGIREKECKAESCDATTEQGLRTEKNEGGTTIMGNKKAQQLDEGDLVLFVDDTIAELMERDIAQSTNVHRVLFRRGLL